MTPSSPSETRVVPRVRPPTAAIDRRGPNVVLDVLGAQSDTLERNPRGSALLPDQPRRRGRREGVMAAHEIGVCRPVQRRRGRVRLGHALGPRVAARARRSCCTCETWIVARKVRRRGGGAAVTGCAGSGGEGEAEERALGLRKVGQLVGGGRKGGARGATVASGRRHFVRCCARWGVGWDGVGGSWRLLELTGWPRREGRVCEVCEGEGWIFRAQVDNLSRTRSR